MLGYLYGKRSAYKIQTPGNYPEESIQYSEHGESLKSRIEEDYFFAALVRVCNMVHFFEAYGINTSYARYSP